MKVKLLLMLFLVSLGMGTWASERGHRKAHERHMYIVVFDLTERRNGHLLDYLCRQKI